MIRFVVISDTHVHPWTAFAKGDGLNNTRLQLSLSVLRESLEYASKNGLGWIHCGDLVHTAGYSLNVVLSRIASILSEFPEVEKYVVWGNHDARGVGGIITLDETVWSSLGVIPNLHVLNHERVMHRGEVLIYGVGYQPDPQFHPDDFPDADIGIFHQTVSGSRTPDGFELTEGINARTLIEKFRVSLVGHVHHSQMAMLVDDRIVFVPGSPEQQNFGEKGDHGWWVLEIPDEGRPDLAFMDPGSPRFVTVDSPSLVKKDGNYYRVRGMKAGESLPEGVAVIAPEPTVIEQRDILRGASEVAEVLDAWTVHTPPEEPEGLEHSDDCAVMLGGTCDCPALKEWSLGEYLSVGEKLLGAQDPIRLRDARVRSLWLHNFLSYRDQQFTIPEGLHLIVGKGRDFPSNGAGKTSLAGEALFWLLFDKNTKGLASDEVIHWGESDCFVEAVIEEEDSTLIVRRGRKPSGPYLEVSQDGDLWEAPGSREMTDKLTRYLGLTPSIFQNLGYFSQEKVLLFASATDGERKNILADLIGLAAYQEASASAGARLTSLSSQLDIDRSALEDLEGRREAIAGELREAKEVSQEWTRNHLAAIEIERERLERLRTSDRLPSLRSQEERIQARSERLKARYRERSEAKLPEVRGKIHADLSEGARSTMEDAETSIAAVKKEISDEHGSLEKAEELVAHLPSMKAKESEIKIRISELRGLEQSAAEATAETQATLRGIGEQLHALEGKREATELSLSQGVCPECGQEISDELKDRSLANIDAQLQGLRSREGEAKEKARDALTHRKSVTQELRAKDADLETVRSLISRVEQARRDLNRILEWYRLIDSQKDFLAALDAKAETEAIKAMDLALSIYDQKQGRRLDRVRRFIESAERYESEQRSRIESKIEMMEEEVNPHAGLISHLAKKKVELDGKELALVEQISRREIQAGIYEYWRHGFSKQGIQSLLLEEIATLFNKNRGEIFPILTQGVYDAQFSTLSQTRSGEIREKTDFIIYQHGEEIPYGSLSGGQRRRVDLGIMLVLTQSVAEWMGIPGILGILTLDEVFGFLDDSGAEGLLEALKEVEKQIPTIFAITHDSHLQSMFPEVIRVEQDSEGVSHVVS